MGRSLGFWFGRAFVAALFAVPGVASAAYTAFDDVIQLNEGDSLLFDPTNNDVFDNGPALVVGNSSPPGAGTVTRVSGDLRFTPNTGFSGQGSFIYLARDQAFSFGVATISFTVFPVAGAPVLTADNVTGNEDQPIALNLNAALDTTLDNDGSETLTAIRLLGVPDGSVLSAGTDAGGGTYTFGSAAEFAGLTLTPPENFNGDIVLTLEADVSDAPVAGVGDNTTGSLGFTVTVDPVNDPPVLETQFTDVNVLEDSGAAVVNLSANYSDIEDSAAGLNYGAVNDNAGLFASFTVVGGNLNFEPAPNASGIANVDISAQDTDGAQAATLGEFRILIGEVNDTPTVVSPISDVVALEDAEPIAVNILSTFTDVESPTQLTYTVSADADPAGVIESVVILGTTLTITLVAEAHTGDPATPATIVVTAADPEGADVDDVFTLTVTAVDDLPDAVDDDVTMIEDEGDPDIGGFVEIDVLANDFAQDSPVTLTLADGEVLGFSDTTSLVPDAQGDLVSVPNGELSVSEDGTSIAYFPREHFSGEDRFSYLVTDANGDTDTALVTITVTPVNDPPTPGENREYTVEENQVLSIGAPTLLSGAEDVDNDALTVALASGTLNGTLTFDTEGGFVYTPSTNFNGSDSFTYVVQDGTEQSASVNVNITVTEAPPAPEPPPPGELEFDFDLARTPLEQSLGVESNVLVVMDDSTSMDWAIISDGFDNLFTISSAGLGSPATTDTLATDFGYLLPLSTNQFADGTSGGYALPSQEAVDASPDLVGNNYGVWRGRTSRVNSLYYNPEVEYKPWVGLDPNNVEWANADPEKAALDPVEYDPNNALTYLDLTAPITYVSQRVPAITGASAKQVCVRFRGRFTRCLPFTGLSLTNTDYYIPRYYTSSDADPLAHDAQRTLIEIRDANGDGDNNPATNPSIYVGGPDRLDCAADDGDPSTCTYTQEIQNFANWFSYYRSREYVAKASLGAVLEQANNLRVGYATINDVNNRRTVASMNPSFRAGEKKTVLDLMYSIESVGATPLRTSLRGAGRYLSCLSGDLFGSASDSNPGDAACPQLPIPDGQCQSNYMLLFTDGAWNGLDYTSLNHDGPGFGDSDFDGGVFSDGFSSTLGDVAMFFYERDSQSTLPDVVPTQRRDLLYADSSAFGDADDSMHQHVKTYTIAFGIDGTLTDDDIPATHNEPGPTWPNPTASTAAKIDDLRHAALNGRGQFLSANNPANLLSAFRDAFDDFAEGSTSVSAVSLNATELDAGTVRYRGTFNLGAKSGDITAFRLEDDATVGDQLWSAAAQLDQKDPSQRVIYTSSRNAGTGAYSGVLFTPDTLDPFHLLTLSTDQVNYLRGDRSQEQPFGSLRARQVNAGGLGDFVHSAPIFVGESPESRARTLDAYADGYEAFATNVTRTRTPVLYAGSNDGMLHGFDANTGEELMAYIPNKLIDSRENYRNVLNQFTSPTYSHEFFTDLTPAVADVYMRAGLGASRTWNTVLLGGCEAGCKGYFLLNVTDPTDYTAASVNSTVLWEFTDTDDLPPEDGLGEPLVDDEGDPRLDLQGAPVKDLGYSFSEPGLLLSNVKDGNDNKWVAVFGNGYNSTSGIAKLFVLFLDDGLDGWQEGDFVKIDTGFGVQSDPHPLAGLPNGLGSPTFIDEDLNGTVDLAYAGDILGNLYRFDLRSANPAEWEATLLFTAEYTDPDTSAVTPQPITERPLVRKHPTEDDGFLVIVGTGSFITNTDGVSQDIQSVYGIWDRLISGSTPDTAVANARTSKLVEQVMTKVALPADSLVTFARILSDNPVDYTAAAAERKFGWYFDLDVERPANRIDGSANPDSSGRAPPGPQFPGERAIRRMITRGTTVFTATVIPRTVDSCLRPPPGALINFDLTTGGNPGAPTLDFNADGVIDRNDLIEVDGVEYAAGIDFDKLRFLSGPDGAFDPEEDPQLVDPTVVRGPDGKDFIVFENPIGIKSSELTRTGRYSWRRLEVPD